MDADGKLIGIITAIASGNGYYTGYSFAIPSNLAHKVAHDLKQHGYVQRAYLGVNVAEVDSRIAEYKGLKEIKGVYLGRVLKGAAAYNAGLRDGDIILSINNIAVNSFAELMEELGKYSPGDEITVIYDRNNKQHTATVMLLNIHGTTDLLKRQTGNTFEMYGAKFEQLSADMLRKMNLSHGIEVVQTGNSFLAQIGIRNGFVITEINKKSVGNKKDIEKIRYLKGKVIIEGYYKDNDRKLYYIVEL